MQLNTAMVFNRLTTELLEKFKINPARGNGLNISMVKLFILSTLFIYLSLFFLSNLYRTHHAFHMPLQDWASPKIAVDYQMLQEYGAAYLHNEDTSPDGRNPYPPFVTMISGYILQNIDPVIFQCLLLFFIMAVVTITFFYSTAGETHLIFLVCGLITMQLISYGTIFELERGQFNFIAYSLCLLSIFCFALSKRFQGKKSIEFWLDLSMILSAAISIHLKVFPLIVLAPFLIAKCLTSGFRISNRFVWLFLTVNLAFLLMPGRDTLAGFLKGLKEHQLHPYLWAGNHSILSFLDHIRVTIPFVGLLFVLLWVLLSIYFGVQLYRNKIENAEILILPFFLLSCLIPNVSHDYKLSFILPVMILHLKGLTIVNRQSLKYVLQCALLVSLLLLPYTNNFVKTKTPFMLILLFFSLRYIFRSGIKVPLKVF